MIWDLTLRISPLGMLPIGCILSYQKNKVMRERKKPKESWIQRAKREIENADYLLALRNLELKLIRKEKEKSNEDQTRLPQRDVQYARNNRRDCEPL